MSSAETGHRSPRGNAVFRRVWLCVLLAGAMAVGAALLPAVAQEKARPYDRDLFRLSELLGAIHYLRELCSSGDGTRWRDQMEALIEAEGTSALRKVRLTKRFNKGYRSFQRTYRSCTQTAETAIARFVGEGAEIASRLIKDENDNAAPDAAAGDDG